MKRELEQLRADLVSDRRVLDRCLEKLGSLDVSPASDEAKCALVALTLHQVYTAVENTLKRIASAFEGLPRGDRWHRDLLDAMARDVDLRPHVLSQAATDALTEVLAFRHYLIHGSLVMSPDGERLTEVRARALEAGAQLTRDLDRFDAHLETLVTSASG